MAVAAFLLSVFVRDACTCQWLRPTLRQNQALCAACQAWEDGYVLIDGERRYHRATWVFAHRADAEEEVP